MTGIADERILRVFGERLAAGPTDVVDLFAAARSTGAEIPVGEEGGLHALLRRLVRAGRARVVGRGPLGGAVYAGPAAPGIVPSTGASSARGVPPASAPTVPPPSSRADSRLALRTAAGARDPAEQGRVTSDVLAHLAALGAGAARRFGPAKRARALLAREDRGSQGTCVAQTAWERLRRGVRLEGLSVAGTLGVMAILYVFVAEFRVIPTHSMEPVLEPGDRLLVRKLGGHQVPDRWSVVVFRRGDGRPLVKRAVGLPGERIDLENGDVLVDDERLRKPPEVAQAVREPLVRARADAPEGDERRIGAPAWEQVSPPSTGDAGATVWRYARGLFADDPVYLDPAGRPEPRSMPRPLVHDVYVTIASDDLRKAEVWIEFVDEEGRPANGRRAVGWRGGPDPALVVVAADGTETGTPMALGAGPGSLRGEVTLSYVDGVLHAEAPGADAESRMALPKGHARVSVAGVTSVAIDRDVHYTDQGQFGIDPAFQIPEGYVFFLGDHSSNSEDSRFRAVGPIPLENLIGPAIFRVWPPVRIGRVR